LLGHLAAERLGNWRRYATDERKLIGYIQRLLRGEHCQNGKKLDQQNALSLERIVLDHRPDLFCAEDRQ
jgi:hypothetical protein